MDFRKPPNKSNVNWNAIKRSLPTMKNAQFNPGKVYQDRIMVPGKESHFDPITVDHEPHFKEYQASNSRVPIYHKTPAKKVIWNKLKEALLNPEKSVFNEQNYGLLPVRHYEQAIVRHPIETIYYDVSSDSELEDIHEKLQTTEPMTNDPLNVEAATVEVDEELQIFIQMHEELMKHEPQTTETIADMEMNGNVSSDPEPEDNHEELQSSQRITEKVNLDASEQIEKSLQINYPTNVTHGQNSNGMELLKNSIVDDITLESQMNKEGSSMESVESSHMHEELSTIQVDVEEQCIEQEVLPIEQSISQITEIPSYITQCFVLTNMFDSESQKVANWDIRIRSDVMNQCKALIEEDVTVLIDEETCGILIKCSSAISSYKLVKHLDDNFYGVRKIGVYYCPPERFDRNLF